MPVGDALWMKSMHQALVLGLTIALQECARNRRGTEEEAIAQSRFAIMAAIGDVNQITTESASVRELCLSVQDTMETILSAAEAEVRRNLGLPAPVAQTHAASRSHIH